MDKLESIREEDYGQCDSPRAKKVFINMLDSHMHSPMHTKQPKMKAADGKSINISSPSSYTSSSPSSTSSLSSTSNVHHQKQAMVNQALNGSSEYISKRTFKFWTCFSMRFFILQCTIFSTCQTSTIFSKCNRWELDCRILHTAQRLWTWVAWVEAVHRRWCLQDFRLDWDYLSRRRCRNSYSLAVN